MKFSILILIATIFHQTSIIFLVFLLASEKSINFTRIIISFFVFLIFYSFSRWYLLRFSFFLERMDIYEGNINQKIIIVIYYIFNFLIFKFLFNGRPVTEKALKIKFFIFNINLILFFIMLINLEIPIFLRILRYSGFVNIIFFSIYFFENKMRFSLRMKSLFFIYLSWVFFVFIYPVWDDTYGAFLDNSIIDWFIWKFLLYPTIHFRKLRIMEKH